MFFDKQEQSGFSLLELLIVLAIFFIIATAVITYAAQGYSRQQLLAAEVGIRTSLKEARDLAKEGFADMPHGVYFDKSASSYTIYAGSSYATRDTAYDFQQFWHPSIEISDPASLTFEINFTQDTGTSTATMITLQSPNGATKNLLINNSGVIE